MARPECGTSSDCAEGFSCSAGSCLCGSDAACAANQVCRQGRCEARSRCTDDTGCPASQRCEVTLGTCLAPCDTAAACAPGMDPQVAALLYQCQEGRCLRRCVNDASCGGQGLICEAGVCGRAACATRDECPAGQYCTSATAGRCLAYTACTSSAQCAPDFECRTFDASACPPGFDCAQRLCQELPRCLIDADCARPGSASGGAYCARGHCQPTSACGPEVACASGLLCVAGQCVPGGCRGHADCPAGQACTDGACRTPPAAADVLSVVVSPRAATLAVGGTLRLSLVAFTVSGGSFPLQSGTFTVESPLGGPSDAASVTPEGLVTALKPGRVVVRATTGSSVTPAEALLTLVPALGEGRRVVVVDAASGLPLGGVEVLGCDAPPADAPCPAPVTVTTDSDGVAAFPSFGPDAAHFSAASPEVRTDGYARYDRVSVIAGSARDVLLPLTENPVHAAAGFNAAIQFSEVHTTGEAWLGFSVLSVGDVPELDLSALLGEPFAITLPGLPQTLPVPGSVVAYVATRLASPAELKGRSLGLGQSGRRAAVAFAGKAGVARLGTLGSLDLLAYSGAMDYALQGFTHIPRFPRVPDASDLDGDGLCSDAVRCASGSEDLPDYFRFPGFSHRPRREQLRRTEVVLPRLPSGLDTAVASAVEVSAEAGLVPLGFASRTAGAPLPDGTRTVDPLLLRSGAPYGGIEAGTPGVWALALQAANTGRDESGRIVRASTLPTRVEVPAFLPVPSASHDAARRSVIPLPASWNALSQGGAQMLRVTLTGARGRHVLLAPLDGPPPSALRIPDAPASAPGEDPATQATARVEVVAMDFSAGVTAAEALDLAGPNLVGLSSILEGYSRSRP
ncbi:Ig-like domain-containing protein [Myxococcaceae bacterium GXIMD 01537]